MMAYIRRTRPVGAIPKAAVKRPRPARQFLAGIVRLLQWLLWTAVALAIVAAGYQLTAALLAQPVNRVGINGQFQYLDREAMVLAIKPYLSAGLVRVDLDGIRSELLAMPWVMEASVSRRWPDQLEVTVVEQTPIAHWGEQAYLNNRGDVFRPERTVPISGLPQLSGPDAMSATVIETYRALGELMRSQGLTLDRLELDARSSWHATVNNRITVVLGKDQVLEKMQRLLAVYQRTLKNDLNRIEKIDMRYSNGLAVSWLSQSLQGPDFSAQ